jgi:hypothetical protein
MKKKSKFKPEITRIKLNPEQAVLACQCSTVSRYGGAGTGNTFTSYCQTAFSKSTVSGFGPWASFSASS